MLWSIDEMTSQSERWTSDHLPNDSSKVKTKNINIIPGQLFRCQC